jgi:hypothetical protein
MAMFKSCQPMDWNFIFVTPGNEAGVIGQKGLLVYVKACTLLAVSALAAMPTLLLARQVSAASGPRVASQLVLPRGIYLYREQLTNDAQFDQALSVPGIDGMAVVLDWSTIQPSPDSFNTETIDSQLKLARRHNLPIELVVRAGRSVPAWVAPNAQLKLAYAPHQGLGNCSPVNMPPP